MLLSPELVDGIQAVARSYASKTNREIKCDEVEFCGFDNQKDPEPYFKCWYSFGIELASSKTTLFGESLFQEARALGRDFIYVWFSELSGPARLDALRACL